MQRRVTQTARFQRIPSSRFASAHGVDPPGATCQVKKTPAGAGFSRQRGQRSAAARAAARAAGTAVATGAARATVATRTAGAAIAARPTVATTRTTTARTGALRRLRAAVRLKPGVAWSDGKLGALPGWPYGCLLPWPCERLPAPAGRPGRLRHHGLRHRNRHGPGRHRRQHPGPSACRTDGPGRQHPDHGPRAPGPALRWPLGPVLTPSGTYQVRNAAGLPSGSERSFFGARCLNGFCDCLPPLHR